VMSFTLTPMLASRFLKHHDEHSRNPLAIFGRFWEAGYERLAAFYRGLLATALKPFGRPLVVLVAAGTLLASFMMLQTNLVGSEYAPQDDDSQFIMNVTTPPGTSLVGTDQTARQLEERLRKLPEVTTIFTSVGTGGGLLNLTNVRQASLAVELVEKKERSRTIFQVLSEIRRWNRDFPDTQIRTNVSNPLVGGGGS